VEEIIGDGRVVRSVHILPRTRDSFTLEQEFDIEMYVVIFIDSYYKFQIILIDGARGLYAVSIDPRTDV